MRLTLGGREYPHVKLCQGTYGDGSLALIFKDENLERLATATVYLDVSPSAGCVWIKDWSENEGMLDSLVKARIIEPTGRTQPTGWVKAIEARLLVDLAQVDRL